MFSYLWDSCNPQPCWWPWEAAWQQHIEMAAMTKIPYIFLKTFFSDVSSPIPKWTTEPGNIFSKIRIWLNQSDNLSKVRQLTNQGINPQAANYSKISLQIAINTQTVWIFSTKLIHLKVKFSYVTLIHIFMPSFHSSIQRKCQNKSCFYILIRHTALHKRDSNRFVVTEYPRLLTHLWWHRLRLQSILFVRFAHF